MDAGDHWVLNGSKIFITNAGFANVFIIIAITGSHADKRGRKVKDISAFIVERTDPGFSVGKHEKKMGIKGSSTCELIMEDCIIPKDRLLGKQGGQLYDYAAGLEHSPVTRAGESPPPKSVGNGITFRRNLLGWEDIHTGVALLSDSVAMRLRKYALKCSTVQVTIRDPNFRDICRQKRLGSPSYVSRDISRAAMALIREAWNPKVPIRALTITGQNLVPEGEVTEQLDLFRTDTTPQRQRRERLEHTVDGIRSKYGKASILPAATVGEDIDHPSGHAGSIPPPGGSRGRDRH